MRRDIFAIRYENDDADAAGPKSGDTEGEKNEEVRTMEIFSTEGLRAYIPHCRKTPDFDEEEIIDDVLNAAMASADSERVGRLLVPYSNSSSHVRRYARGPSCQKLSRLGGSAAFRTLGVDIDKENCHHAMLVRALRQAYASDDNDDAPISDAFAKI